MSLNRMKFEEPTTTAATTTAAEPTTTAATTTAADNVDGDGQCRRTSVFYIVSHFYTQKFGAAAATRAFSTRSSTTPSPRRLRAPAFLV